jgi:maltose/moltooligosaccharide transporter
MAAGLLWVLDASINISMEPFRAFVGDMMPKEQVTRGFTMQSFFIGLGAVFASLLPWILTEGFGMAKSSGGEGVPTFLKVSFAIGGVAFMAAVLWTIRSTKEYPPADLEAFRQMKKESGGIGHMVTEILSNIKNMPTVMRQLAVVQFFTWIGLFLMWFYFTVAVANDVMEAPNPQSDLYAEGVAWANLCFGFYSIVTFIFALMIPSLTRRFGKKYIHSVCLVAGFIGLISVGMAPDKYWLLLSMVGVGIAWASILSMPYAILAPQLPPEKMGIYMGIFNFFIVIPEILATLFFGFVMEHWLENDRLAAVMLGGCMLLMAAIAVLFVNDNVQEADVPAIP